MFYFYCFYSIFEACGTYFLVRITELKSGTTKLLSTQFRSCMSLFSDYRSKFEVTVSNCSVTITDLKSATRNVYIYSISLVHVFFKLFSKCFRSKCYEFFDTDYKFKIKDNKNFSLCTFIHACHCSMIFEVLSK